MQAGNIFFALFGAVGLVGVVGASATTVIKGPISGMARVTDYSVAKNDMIAAAVLLSEATLAQKNADCDADGMIEPPPPRIVNGMNAPAGGGLLPAGTAATQRDPWRRDYGYCAWDHGFWTASHDIGACGGIAAGRRNGTNTDTHPVIAIISAGPNGVFETTCHDYTDDAQPLVTHAPDGDDLVRLIPYGQFMMPSSATARLDELPDAACTGASVGLMRITLGTMQVCAETGWTEISPASGGELYFVPVQNAVIGSSHQSNAVTFGTLASPLPVSVSGGATLSINGGPAVTSGAVQSDDTITLSAIAPAQPETTHLYTVAIGSVTKTWSITTRDAYIGKLSVTPIQHTGMTVNGPGSPAYGATVGFIVTNAGERMVGPLNPALLSNSHNFVFNNAGPHVGDDCAGKMLQGTMTGAQSCVIDVRPKANNDTPYFDGMLVVGDGDVSASVSMSGSATGWGCTAPWGAYIANGAQVTAYREACNLLGCKSETRSCANANLTGTYQYATCSSLLGCL